MSLLALLGFLRANWKAFAIGGAALALVGVGLYIHHAGGNSVRVEVAKQSAKAVKVSRQDERTAQSSANVVGEKVATKIQTQRATEAQTIVEIKHELAASPAGSCSPVSDGVRERSNALIADANRSAVYAGPAD
jgi:hypothetical protein